jgi:hypothetical protein
MSAGDTRLARPSEAVGREVTFTGTDTLRIADGKFAEYWANADSLLFFQQLGVREVPPADELFTPQPGRIGWPVGGIDVKAESVQADRAGVTGRCLGRRSLGLWVGPSGAGQGPPQLSA